MKPNLLWIAALWACLSACGGSPAIPSPQPLGTLTSLAVGMNSGPQFTVDGELLVGRSAQIMATARYTNGGHEVTNVATWQTANPNIVTVSSTGVVTAIAPGSARITATYEGFSGSLTVFAVP